MTDENNLEIKGIPLIELMFPHIHWERRNQEKAMSWAMVNANK